MGTDGVKIPYRWTLARPNGSFSIHVDEVQQNIPLDGKRFVPPSRKGGTREEVQECRALYGLPVGARTL